MADVKRDVLWVLHGVNLDMLGRRSEEHYGTVTLAGLCDAIAGHAVKAGFETRCFQTNHEGRMVEQLHALARGDEPVHALIINPGAWTHYSWAIRDALELLQVPVAEVHLSAVEEREEWRRVSVIADLAAVRIAGEGVDGYLRAVDELAELVGGRR